VAISAGQTADSIVTSINGKSADTGVRSTAVTTVTVDTLSANGTVTMDLFGDNVNASNISAAVTATDLTALIKSINDVTGTTGITAAVGTDNSQMLLTHSAGKDIKISGFTHSSAVDYARTSDTIIVGDGTSLAAPSTQYSMNVTGGTGTSAVTLFDGAGANGLDSTIVGGEVTLISDQTFSVASSVANNVAGVGSGSLFSTAASVSNSSSASRVSDINIGSVAGAQSAISVLDEALQAISTIRSGLGALQSRFETTGRSISNSIENLSAARSRILDADFAVETSDLTKNQILQQAGTSILSQSNQITQNVLALLG
jgi:flagellin